MPETHTVPDTGEKKKMKERIPAGKPSFLRVLALLSFLFCSLVSSALLSAPAEHVIMISLDGARPDVILASNMPNTREMSDKGAYTWWAQSISPSSTLPAHSSMLSGSLPEKHGITWNSWKAEGGYVLSTTCFEIAKRAGRSTSMFVGKQKLEHISKPGTVDKFIKSDDIKSVGEYFLQNKPNLLFIHFSSPDEAGHRYGWGSQEQRMELEKCDKNIGLLREYVGKSGASAVTVWIITADHGGHAKSHGSKDVRDMTVPWICYGPGIIRQGQIEKPVSICDTAATSVSLLGLEPDIEWHGKAQLDILMPGQTLQEIIPETGKVK